MKKEWHVNIVESRCNVYRKQIRIDNRVCTIFIPVKLAQYHFLNDCKSTSIFSSVVYVAIHPPTPLGSTHSREKKEVQQGKCIEKSRELSSVWEDDSFLFLTAMVRYHQTTNCHILSMYFIKSYFRMKVTAKKSIWFLVGAQFLIAKNIQSNRSDFIVVIQTEFICFELFVWKVCWHFLRLTIPSNVSVFKMNFSLRGNESK